MVCQHQIVIHNTNLTNSINLTCPTCYATGVGPGPTGRSPELTGRNTNLDSNPVLQPGNNTNITPLVNKLSTSDAEIDLNTIKSNPPPSPPPKSNFPYKLIGVIVTLLVAGGIYYFFIAKKSTSVESTTEASTTEASTTRASTTKASTKKGGYFNYGE